MRSSTSSGVAAGIGAAGGVLLAAAARGGIGGVELVLAAASAVGAGILAGSVHRKRLEAALEPIRRVLGPDPDPGSLADEAAARLTGLERENRSLQDAEDTRDLVLSSMAEGVLLMDTDGLAVFSNPPMADLLAAAPQGVQDLAPAALRDAVAQAAAGIATDVEVETGSPSRWLQGAASPVAGGGVLLVLRDVTQAKRLEAVRRDFVANASHELKTPTATIQATAETLLLAAGDDPGAVPRFAERIEVEALRMSRIVSDLLDLSRLESGDVSREPVALAAMIGEEVDRARPAAERGEVALVTDLSPATIMGSRNDLSLLARNLIDNAIRYSRVGGEVRVSLEPQRDVVELRVEDRGIGIPRRDLARIFERFYRVDRARSRETGGTGLGLSIVRHVVENHGGTIAVESELGSGTTFRVTLPVDS